MLIDFSVNKYLIFLSMPNHKNTFKQVKFIFIVLNAKLTTESATCLSLTSHYTPEKELALYLNHEFIFLTLIKI